MTALNLPPSVQGPPGPQGPAGVGAIPTGMILAYAGVTPPAGFLVCDGAAVSRTTYADLWSALQGAGWGNGDGSTTFNVPNLTGRSVVGIDTTQTVIPSMTTVGAASGVHQAALTAAQMPVHNHGASTASAGGHVHTVNGSNLIHINYPSTYGIRSVQPGDIQTVGTDMDTAGAHTHPVTVNNAGSGAAVSRVQPCAAVNYIIKT